MTWTQVQVSPEAATGSGTTVTPTFSGGTTAGNVLVATLYVGSSTAVMSLPSGWVQGPAVTNGGNQAQIWYYTGNPGGITSVVCTSTVTTNLKAAVAEFSTDVAGATVVGNALGTGTAGAVATCTATTSTNAAAGDLAVAAFAEHFTANTAMNWTDPSGFTLIASDHAGTSGNHLYSAYNLSTAAGSLSVTGTSDTATTSANGWTGTVITFSAQVTPPPGSTWVLTQKSASQGSTSSGTSVTGTLPGASTGSSSRPHLVVACLLATNGTWTLPAGWLTAADVINGTSVRATIAYTVDTTGGVGTSTVFTYSTAQNLKVFMAEYDPGVDGLTVTLHAHGTGVAGAVTQCTATTGTAAGAGDLAVACFAEHFTSVTGVTWTAPSGFTLIGSDGASSGGNHEYCAYDLAVAGGSVAVTGKSSPGTTSANGWAGAVATFTAATAPVSGARGYVGAFLNPGWYGTGTTTANAINDWQANSARTLTARRSYWGPGSFPSGITADLAADAAAGRKACVSFRPAYNPPTTGDLAALNNTLSSFKAGGLVADVALWHEPYYGGLTAAQYIAMIKYYGPTVRQYYPLAFVTSAGSVWNNNENSFYPGDSWVDKVATDFYPPAYNLGVRFGSGGSKDPASPADSASPQKPFGLWEFNTSTDPAKGQTQGQATTIWSYVQTYFTSRLTAGLSNAEILVFNSTNADGSGLNQDTPITVADGLAGYEGITEYRNNLFGALFDALDFTSSPAPGTVYFGGELDLTLTAAAGFTTTTVVSVATLSLPADTVGTPYAEALGATGGNTPYTWAVVSGSLPPGLSLSSAGLISGVPTTAGSYTFTVQVTSS